ncbi:MAG TPA: tryptophan synthase subunit alpha [Salinimicrobium sp.]|nr:tryptophan synthase subunit alpha [Salinimicrobium sp.]
MNRINQKLQEDKKLLSIYFTAGFPELQDTTKIIEELENSGVDFLEIGLPFSDPLADGPTIQESSAIALKNGMTTEKLFRQLEGIREKVNIPLIIMGYFNPILQFGVENFCQRCRETGIDGVIIPDLPVEEYLEHYREIFEKHQITVIFLITPQTPEKRIRFIDSVSKGFIYMVSTASVTGTTSGFQQEQIDYFKRLSEMNLKAPQIVGFGINNSETFSQATLFSKGAIIGSAYIKELSAKGISATREFVESLR